jgi:hypothetical protein
MKETAVEWLIKKIAEDYPEIPRAYREEYQKAKAMEKEMIIKSNRDGIDMVVNKENFITGEQYYNETYNK